MGNRIAIRWPPHTNRDLRTKEPRSRITRLFFPAVLSLTLCAGIERAGAQFRLDVSLCLPMVSPIVGAGWQFTFGNVRAGAGLDGLVAIELNAFWPDAFLEYELGPLVLRADLGGGLIYRFGFGAVETSPNLAMMVIPQIDVSLVLTDWMRVGVGVLTFEALESTIGSSVVVYLGVRFIIWGSKRSPTSSL